MLDPNVKAKWVKALRSGKYKKGMNHLKKRTEGVDRFCCLGVACEIGITQTDNNFLLKENFLPYDIQQFLALMNDKQNNYYTFERIAVWIEENL